MAATTVTTAPEPGPQPAMPRFEHIRHKLPEVPAVARELVVACPPMRSHVNLSHIVRTCGCFGIRRAIACGAAGVACRTRSRHVTIER